MKTDLAQFIYSAQLPNGQPINLQIAVARDGNYLAALQVWVLLLTQGSEEFKKEIAAQNAN